MLKGLGRLLSSADLHAETFNDPEKFLKISPSTRVIIFTGKDDPLVRSTALNAGASAFIIKPFDDEELLTAVRLALAPAN